MKRIAKVESTIWVSAIALACVAAGCDRPATPPPPGPAPAGPAATPPPTTSPTPAPTVESATTAPTRPQQQSSAAPPTDAATPEDDPTVARFLGLEGPKPATWVWRAPSRPMRTAEYIVPGEGDADAAEIVVFFFGPGQGGDIQPNIDRWQQQFLTEDDQLPEPIVTKHETDGMPVTIVELEGRFRAMGAPSYLPDRKAIQTIIDADVGRVFVRLVGPRETVDRHHAAFQEMILGLKRSR